MDASKRPTWSSRLRHPAGHCAGECNSCRISFNKVPLAPMLQNEVWCKLAAEKEVLCAECCFRRASERGIDITRANLRLCVLNLAGWPWSYFNLFTDAKKQSSDRRAHIYEEYLKRCEVGSPVGVAHQENSAESGRQVRAP
jgi:hypothetical protein